jgi:hypothetical protein
MALDEDRAEEIEDAVLEVLDDEIAPLTLEDSLEAIEAVKGAIGMREQAIREDLARAVEGT